jgi:hypothetical protein
LIFGKWVTTFWKTFGQVSVMLENDGRHPALASRLRMAISSKEHGALLNACKNFEESLKGFIRNPKAGGAAQVAAQCLFEVRKLEDALCRKMTKRDRCENRSTSKQKGFMDRPREMLQAAMVGTDMRDDPEYKKGVK